MPRGSGALEAVAVVPPARPAGPERGAVPARLARAAVASARRPVTAELVRVPNPLRPTAARARPINALRRDDRYALARPHHARHARLPLLAGARTDRDGVASARRALHARAPFARAELLRRRDRRRFATQVRGATVERGDVVFECAHVPNLNAPCPWMLHPWRLSRSFCP